MIKNNKIIAIVCTSVNVILITACILFYVQTDKQKPEFKLIPSELVYHGEMDKSVLLEDISAVDNRDGNVTEKIIVEKMIFNEKDKSLIVFYAVVDKAGNVAKISRVFPTSQS